MDNRIEAIRELRGRGKSFGDIAFKLGLSLGVVAGIVKRNGIGGPKPLPPKPKIESKPKPKTPRTEALITKPKITLADQFKYVERRLALNPLRRFEDAREEAEIFALEARESAWMEVGSSYMGLDDSY